MGKNGYILGVEKDERAYHRNSEVNINKVLCIVNTMYIKGVA